MFPGIDLRDFQALVTPWYQALRDPKEAQERTLQTLLEHYEETDYGKPFHC